MAAASSSDQCHHFKASGYFTRDCPTLAQRSFPTGGRRVGKETVAILRPSGVPTTRPPPTVALNVTSRRSSSSWLRTWCSGDHLNNASPTSGVLSSCKPLNQSLNPSQKHSGSHSARWVLPWLRRPRQLQPRRRLLRNQLANQQFLRLQRSNMDQLPRSHLRRTAASPKGLSVRSSQPPPPCRRQASTLTKRSSR